MPAYPDYKYNAFVRYLSLCKAGEEPAWGRDPVFTCYSTNCAKKLKTKSTLLSSNSLRQSFKNAAKRFVLGGDETILTKKGKRVLRVGEYDGVLKELHDGANHPGMSTLRSKVFEEYADVCYDKIDDYVRNCPVCSQKKGISAPAKKERKQRGKRARDSSPDHEEEEGTKAKQKSIRKAASSPLVCYPLRLHPGAEIKSTLQTFVTVNELEAAFILSCVGSVRKCKLRLADSETMMDISTNHEIVSLTGTLSAGGHLHASLSDEFGEVKGGHVMGEMEVFTTAEIVIGNMPSFRFKRTMDQNTSYKELAIDNVLATCTNTS